jgi:hypothetical protein
LNPEGEAGPELKSESCDLNQVVMKNGREF